MEPDPTSDPTRPKSARRFAKARPHEWVSFEDPEEERVWMFDVTFLTSGWMCIYGNGCPGIEEEPAPEKAFGCCVHGAHFIDADDAKRVKRYAERLTDNQWQLRSLALGRGSVGKGAFTFDESTGDRVSRIVDGACIFLNRVGFPGGPGCALHRAALDAGDQPLEWKPEVCWQVPVRREDHDQPDGSILSIISQWDRGHWGEGGHDFGWWCTEDEGAFVSKEPVYVHSRAELTALTSKQAYEMLASYLDGLTGGRVASAARLDGGSDPTKSIGDAEPAASSPGGSRTLLPHPVVRRQG